MTSCPDILHKWQEEVASASQDEADKEAAAVSVSVLGSVSESQEAGNIVPATPKREREATRSMVRARQVTHEMSADGC